MGGDAEGRDVDGGTSSPTPVDTEQLLARLADGLAEVAALIAHAARDVATIPAVGSDEPMSAAVLRLPSLTSREAEVLARVLDGKRASAIGRELFLSASAVRNHLSALYRKFGVSGRDELVDWFDRGGAVNRLWPPQRG